MAKLYNLAKMTVTSGGAGTLALGVACESFLTFAQAGAQNGDTITYAIDDGENREIGRALYSNGSLFSRAVLASTNDNLAIDVSTNAMAMITAAAEDFGAGILPAVDITYTNPSQPSFATVEDALDHIFYVAPQIIGFSNNVGTVEIGQTITSVTFDWSYNKPMVSASFTGLGPSISPTLDTETITGSWTAFASWTLTASDGSNSTSASSAINFDQKRYWGVSANATLDNAQILALGGSEFASGFDKSLSYDCAAGDVYPYYAYPAAWGSPSNVTVGGLAFSAFTLAAQSFTNASGYTSSYNVIRFSGVQSGANISVVWA